MLTRYETKDFNMKLSIFSSNPTGLQKTRTFGLRQFNKFCSWFSTMLSPRRPTSSKDDTGKRITVKHRFLTRLVKRSTSSHLEPFATNTLPSQGLRLSTSNMMNERPAQRLFRRKSSAPITPKTMGRRRTFLSTDGLRKALARDSVVRRSFEAYAEEQYALENVVFMENLHEWRNAQSCSLFEAQRICETFIYDGSCMQINISYSARTEIEHKMASIERTGIQFVPSSLFDTAAAEITTMMQGGLWGTFVSRGGCDRAESLAEALDRRSDGRRSDGRDYSRDYIRARSTTNGLVEYA